MSVIGIIGAMEEEVADLKAAMSEVTIRKKAGMEFHEGNLNGMPVVVVQCGVGKVNAAMCVQILADLYDVTHIINTGVAGSLNPVLDTTAADITINFNLNLRDTTDNFVLKVFKAWENLSYDLSDGTRSIKQGYISDNLRIAEANRDGSIWRSYIFHHIMLTGVTGLDDLDYQSNDARQLTCTFRCDYWEDEIS